jgi:hypothetical protein
MQGGGGRFACIEPYGTGHAATVVLAMAHFPMPGTLITIVIINITNVIE